MSPWLDDDGAVICEIRDAGHITAGLVGRHAPRHDHDVTGLWPVNQLCDLVEIGSGPGGTQVRLTPAFWPLLVVSGSGYRSLLTA
jgi:hypothetical protein